MLEDGLGSGGSGSRVTTNTLESFFKSLLLWKNPSLFSLEVTHGPKLPEIHPHPSGASAV